MKRKLLFFVASIMIAASAFAAPKVTFDLSHGQFQDVFVKPEFYDYVLPAYREICNEIGAEYAEIRDEITSESLKGVKTLVMISPLARSTQKPITASEKSAIISFIRGGGSVLMFVDEEEYRVILSQYGANDVTRPFGIEIGGDIEGLPGNCGAISFENEIFGGRREIPYSGSRQIKGGIPASVCMEGGWVHASYVKPDGGGKLFVAGETMVALLMGLPDGDRNVHKMMQTRWWGKDSRLYMKELLKWSIKFDDCSDEEAIRNVIERYAQSINAADVKFAETFWQTDDKVVFIHPRGTEFGWEAIKTNFYGKTMGETFSKRELKPRNISISVYGDMAIVVFFWDFYANFRSDSSPHVTHGRETQVMRKIDGQWRIAHVHYSNMPVTGDKQGF